MKYQEVIVEGLRVNGRYVLASLILVKNNEKVFAKMLGTLDTNDINDHIENIVEQIKIEISK